MEDTEFDKHADHYAALHAKNIAITGEGPEYFSEYKISDAHKWTEEAKLQTEVVLDFGAGIGNSIPYFRHYFPSVRLICGDVSRRSLEVARQRFGAVHQSILFEDRRIPMPDNACDLIFTACVFHHIAQPEHTHWLRECLRVTRPGGMLLVFEHNPWNPLTVKAVNTCPFDVNARLISSPAMADCMATAGWQNIKARYRIFFPRFLSAMRPLERWLYAIPLGAQYAMIGRKVRP